MLFHRQIPFRNTISLSLRAFPLTLHRLLIRKDPIRFHSHTKFSSEILQNNIFRFLVQIN